MNVDVYRSEKKEGAYLYVRKGTDISGVDADLLVHFGQATRVMSIDLAERKELAQVKSQQVIASIEKQAYYVQMPRLMGEAYMQMIPNSKL